MNDIRMGWHFDQSLICLRIMWYCSKQLLVKTNFFNGSTFKRLTGHLAFFWFASQKFTGANPGK
jgi:hypothetical protein